MSHLNSQLQYPALIKSSQEPEVLAILLMTEYRSRCREVGVGDCDKVADSVESYVSYLKRLGRIANEEIGSATVRNEHFMKRLTSKLEAARVNSRSINSIKSAMRRYVEMVQAYASK